jgi:hydroxymethylglutaryl-CoA lyase
MTAGPLTIREVGPRDGLQAETPLPVAERVELVEDLVGCGLEAIEVAAFVSPRQVPAMAEAAAVMAELLRVSDRPAGLSFFALVPNLRGAQMALEAGTHALTVTVSASDGYSRRNVGHGRQDAARTVGEILEWVGGRILVDVVVSAAFGYAGREPADLDWVEGWAASWAGAGPCSLTLADTTGEALPPAISMVVDRLGPDIGLHLHDARGTALANALHAIGRGVRRFDTAVAGLGGSPFAEGETGGNLATEDLVHLAEVMGLPTGVQLESLVELSRRVSARLARRRRPGVAAAGPSVSWTARH